MRRIVGLKVSPELRTAFLRWWLLSALALAIGAAAACANRAGMETQRVAGQGGAP